MPLSRADFGPVDRLTDPGGGGYTYVIDRAIASIPVVPRTVSAGAHTINLTFAPGFFAQFRPEVQRFDLGIALGRIDEPFGDRFVTSAGAGAAATTFSLDNFASSTKVGFASTYTSTATGQIIGVGSFQMIDAAGGTLQPGQPYELSGLALSLNVSQAFIDEGDVPAGPIDAVAVYIGAGLNSPTAQVPTMAPLVTLVPEPTLLSLATALYAAIGRRRRS